LPLALARFVFAPRESKVSWRALRLLCIEAKVALALVTLSEAKSLVPRMTGSLFALSWTVSTCPEPTGTGYRVAPLLRMTERCQLTGDVSL